MEALAGLASKIPGLPTSLPGSIPTPPAPPAPTGIKGFLSKGFTIPWWMHIFLTGIAPFLILIPYIGPTLFTFPYTFGVNGLNLLASNSMSWAAMKAVFNFLFQTLGKVVASKVPGWFGPYIKAFLYYANPWFVFDILQVYNPRFKDDGYKIPFWNKKVNSTIEAKGKRTTADIGHTDANGKATYGLMSVVPMAAMAVLLLPALYTMSDNLPPEMTAKMEPFLNMITTVGAGIAGLAGGGIGTFVLLPNLISSVQSQMSGLMSGGNVEEVVQTGGGNIPTINEVSEAMLKNAVQNGGGDTESNVFMGILAFTIVGGISLALVRRKGSSGYSV